MVAVVFIIVLLVALIFYFKFSLESVEDSGERACIVSNTVLLSSVLSMSEIQCSVNGQTELCVDTSKILVFDPAREYGSLFTTNCDQKIYFEQVYPGAGEEVCSTSNYPDCGIFDFYDPGVSYSSSTKISTPTTLYYPLTDEYKFGKLVIEVLQ